ncbi:RHS repeat-associated core domain-containing protein [Lentzea sp. NPDC004789]
MLVEHAGVADCQTVEQPVELFGVDVVGALDFPDELQGRRADLGIANAFVEGMAVERGLELGSVIGLDILDLERVTGTLLLIALSPLHARLVVLGCRSRPMLRRLDKGFVGGTLDNTGLTHIGAREYDPAIGRFVSVDPVMDIADPQQWNGYAYANNPPITYSDPTGLLPTSCMDDGSNCSTHRTNDHEVASEFEVESEGGITAARHMPSGTTYLGTRALPPGGPDLFKLAAAMRAYQPTDPNYGNPEGDWGEFSEYQLLALAEVVCTYQKSLGCSSYFTLARQLRTSRAAAARFACEDGNSFTGDALVLMADGSTKRVDEVKVGDRVIATDPETGESGAREVVSAIVGEGLKYLVEIRD